MLTADEIPKKRTKKIKTWECWGEEPKERRVWCSMPRAIVDLVNDYSMIYIKWDLKNSNFFIIFNKTTCWYKAGLVKMWRTANCLNRNICILPEFRYLSLFVPLEEMFLKLRYSFSTKICLFTFHSIQSIVLKVGFTETFSNELNRNSKS